MADAYFSPAIQAANVDHTLTAALYIQRLLSSGNPSTASEVLSTVLTLSERIKAIAPVLLRAQAARAAGIAIASSDAEMVEVRHFLEGGGPGIGFVRSSNPSNVSPTFSHNNSSDDCRNAALKEPTFVVN